MIFTIFWVKTALRLGMKSIALPSWHVYGIKIFTSKYLYMHKSA